MKKLMLLGGKRCLLPVVETAHEMGVCLRRVIKNGVAEAWRMEIV